MCILRPTAANKLNFYLAPVMDLVTIDEVRNQSFIMECTSCQRPVTLIDVRGKKIQTQKGFDYKILDAQLQIYLLFQHSFRVRVRI